MKKGRRFTEEPVITLFQVTEEEKSYCCCKLQELGRLTWDYWKKIYQSYLRYAREQGLSNHIWGQFKYV